MPSAAHPQAKFDPIPPDLDLHALVDRTSNFDWVKRISAAQIRNIGQREFEKFVLFHVIQGGKPLVIEKWNDRLPKSLFSADWLQTTYDKKQESVRDIGNQVDIPMTTGHYLRSMRQLTNQWTPQNYRDERRQRLYLKDIDCPPEWQERLRTVIPPNLYYWNENVEQKANRRHEDAEFYSEESVPAPAGDLMSSLPFEMRAQNLMCYIGHEGTYTPAHREMCASLGQNIMVDASTDENGEKAGSSIWFMTETKDREVVREYFLSMLGHDVEIEKHFAQINAWKKATFPVYIVEQKVGDFVLVPPLAPHQVWNRGTRTIKVAWNRITVETLDLALHEALPKTRLVCRDEQYKNKAIIYYTLRKYYQQMKELQATTEMQWLGLGQDLFKDSPRVQQLAKDFKQLLGLFTEIMVDEMFANKEKTVEFIEFDSCVTCSYCRANIFNRFLTCKHCVRQLPNGDEDTYDICMECYAMGRSCLCISGLTWCEQWKWSELADNYEEWRTMVIRNDGYVDFDHSPLPLEVARRKFGKKSVAQICQEQLRSRPWKDITKHDMPSEPEPEPTVDDEGRVVKKKKKPRKKKTGDTYPCHVCSHRDYTYKLAFCSTPGCQEAYCYGVLYRAFDMMPQAVMQNEKWQCPKCLQNCNCGACRRTKRGNPYMPKNTLLGHDTRPIADDRSVETLVDFRVHNLLWLKAIGEEGRSLQSKRMQRLQEVADAEKAKTDEIVNASLPALPEGEGEHAVDDSGLGVVRQALDDGYGDQMDIVNPGFMGQNEMVMPAGPASMQQPNGHQPPGQVAVADMSLVEDDSVYPQPSAYPDPRRLGMGYYEQDDTPDKILFDAFQQPAQDALDDNMEVSEFVKKALRAQKRRARQEEDNDPDFAIPRSHRKRARTDGNTPLDGQQEALNNMDPALFDQDMDMPDAEPLQEAPLEQGEVSAEPEDVEADVAEEPDDPLRPFTTNIPALRHAKPKIAYAEADNGDEDEFDEVLAPKPRPPPPATTAQPSVASANVDPLDAASAAILAIARGGGPHSASASPAPAPPKKRGPGRPPGRPRKSDVSPTATRTPTSEKAASSTPQPTGRRRGRPARSSFVQEAQPTETETEPTGRRSVRPTRSSLAQEIEPTGSDTDLDAQLAAQLAAFDEDGEVIGRAASTPKESTPKESTPKESTPKESTPPPAPATTTTAPRKRGRPPKKAAANGNITSQPPLPARRQTVTVAVRSRRQNRTPSPPPDTRFLSMKERMALKGKKVKITARPRPSGGSGTPSGDKSAGSGSGTPEAGSAARSRGVSPRGGWEVVSRPGTETRKQKVVKMEDDDFVPGAEDEAVSSRAASPAAEEEEEESSDAPSPPARPTRAAAAAKPMPVAPSGLTVVRLGTTDDEDEDEEASRVQSEEDESSSGSDFDDIPAQKTPLRGAMATRGRGTPRGRGMPLRGRVARRGRH